MYYEGKVEEWKPNHVYPFGAVVTYNDFVITGVGYLNNVKPFSLRLEFPFVSDFQLIFN